jgi:hypothetical protein
MPKEEGNHGVGFDRKQGLFKLGNVVATRTFMDRVENPEELMRTTLSRHANGDWGDCCENDKLENDRALEDGERLMSVYRTEDDTKYWVITEWDRSVTTFLLPEDY